MSRWAVGTLPLLALAAAAWPLRGQPGPDPLGLDPSGAVAGHARVGVGVEARSDVRFPVSGLRGDLFVPAHLSLTWAPADRVLLELRGDLWRVLEIRSRGPSAVPLDDGVTDRTTADFGDFALGVAFAPLRLGPHVSLGGRLRVTLPNSDERRGIGTNTTDVLLAVLGALQTRRFRASGELGVAILEAPLERFEQNDVLAYAARIGTGRDTHRFRLALAVRGHASTRGRVPLGTEDRGEVRLGGEWRAPRGPWRLTGGVGHGYAGTSPEWTGFLGVALEF